MYFKAELFKIFTSVISWYSFLQWLGINHSHLKSILEFLYCYFKYSVINLAWCRIIELLILEITSTKRSAGPTTSSAPTCPPQNHVSKSLNHKLPEMVKSPLPWSTYSYFWPPLSDTFYTIIHSSHTQNFYDHYRVVFLFMFLFTLTFFSPVMR